IAVACIVGFDEFLFDAAAILERKGADLGPALHGLLAIRDERVPFFDGAETSCDVPHLRRQGRRVDLLLDLERLRETRGAHQRGQRSKTHSQRTHAFPPIAEFMASPGTAATIARRPRAAGEAKRHKPNAGAEAWVQPSSRRRAMTCAWISAAPSKIDRMRASHSTRLT